MMAVAGGSSVGEDAGMMEEGDKWQIREEACANIKDQVAVRFKRICNDSHPGAYLNGRWEDHQAEFAEVCILHTKLD
jgi:hypothetical protein